jgi:hypothetical protein
MRRAIAGLLAGVMLFAPVSPTLGDSIEVKGDLYNQLGLPKSYGPGDLNLFQGRLGGGLTPPAGACGLNAGFSFLYGISNSLGELDKFITNWQNSLTAVALYGLATYLPVAKEVLLGANTLSNFLAQLRGFSCTQAMETIKELNYQDSFLVKKCIARRLGISETDVDVRKNKNPEEWYNAYKSCLSSASLVDLFGGRDEAEKYLAFISPRSLAKCYLGVNRAPTPEEVANADLNTKAKYFLYMVLPDITLDSNGLLKVRTVQITDPTTGRERPATMVDVTNLYVENFVNDYKKLIEDLKSVVKYEMGHDESFEASKPYFEEFERKYGISVEDMAPALIMVLRMRDYLEKNLEKNKEKGEGSGFTYAVDLQNVDYFIREYFMKVYLDKALQRLEAALDDYLLRLKQAEAMRRSAGSGSIPGDNDGCFNSSSGGST